MMRNSKRGSYIMEAAIVLPIIILVVITAILIIMFFYSQVADRSNLHIRLRAEAGASTGKTIYVDGNRFSEEDAFGEIYVDKVHTGSKAYGKKYVFMDHRGVLFEKGKVFVEGSSFGTDGPRYVRYCTFIKDMGDEK